MELVEVVLYVRDMSRSIRFYRDTLGLTVGHESASWTTFRTGIGAVFLELGFAELVTHLDDPLSLFFWLPALWGGGALVLVGEFGPSTRP